MNTESNGFLEVLKARGFDLSQAQTEALLAYRNALLLENEKQNLTRITDDDAFIDNNLIDCIELEKSGFLGEKNIDWGSGGGIPGLMSAALWPRKWVLVESEKAKARFLSETTAFLGLESHVLVVDQRLETLYKKLPATTIVARAVAGTEKLLNSLSACSTWNNLILLKSKKWSEEWAAAQPLVKRMRLKLKSTHEYVGGKSGAYRIIAQVTRG